MRRQIRVPCGHGAPIGIPMASPLHLGLQAGVRRALARHQQRSAATSASLPRLLAAEAWFIAHRLYRRAAAWLPGAVLAGAILVGLAASTPGPVLPIRWRAPLAAAVAAVAVLVAHAHQRHRSRLSRPDR